jgi:hypothetical protein
LKPSRAAAQVRQQQHKRCAPLRAACCAVLAVHWAAGRNRIYACTLPIGLGCACWCTYSGLRDMFLAPVCCNSLGTMLVCAPLPAEHGCRLGLELESHMHWVRAGASATWTLAHFVCAASRYVGQQEAQGLISAGAKRSEVAGWQMRPEGVLHGPRCCWQVTCCACIWHKGECHWCACQK